jgi:protoheme ferro-lyase
MLTYIFNAVLRLHSWPKHLKVAKIILVLKPGKNPNHVTSYWPISLLSTISKRLEKLIYHRINSIIDEIPLHQFGFRHSHSTIQQCHRIVHKSFEEKKILSLCLFGHKPGF